MTFWSHQTGKPAATPLHVFNADNALNVAYSPDGKTLVAGGNGGAVSMWDLATRKQIGADFPGPAEERPVARFTPDGSHLLVVYGRGRSDPLGPRPGRVGGPSVQGGGPQLHAGRVEPVPAKPTLRDSLSGLTPATSPKMCGRSYAAHDLLTAGRHPRAQDDTKRHRTTRGTGFRAQCEQP